MVWNMQKACKDVHEYELLVEKQKTTHHCEQKNDTWKWSINYHGAQVASGNANGLDAAQKMAEANVPQ